MKSECGDVRSKVIICSIGGVMVADLAPFFKNKVCNHCQGVTVIV